MPLRLTLSTPKTLTLTLCTLTLILTSSLALFGDFDKFGDHFGQRVVTSKLLRASDSIYWAEVRYLTDTPTNYIAVEIECPFGDDASDLPLVNIQTDMIR